MILVKKPLKISNIIDYEKGLQITFYIFYLKHYY